MAPTFWHGLSLKVEVNEPQFDEEFTCRRSTLVKFQGEGLAYAGETITLNLHGWLGSLKLGDRTTVHVHRTGKSEVAGALFEDHETSHFGIELKASKTYGVSELPPRRLEHTTNLAPVPPLLSHAELRGAKGMPVQIFRNHEFRFDSRTISRLKR